ncbi:RNA-binding S4 domain-containing protein [Caldichromatium japonicum]|uniref:Heat shock protein 15 n=2 Tax=Caldichromatium japonicum TaxID=2699430 RepID=A0A6G7VH89_9GAMM|nr:RNA-binding S4 domain-containing protein [Caldichromatium japonicum]
MMDKTAELTEMRLDKWLWAARFYKTRQLAVEAINGGKVHVDGRRVKPSRLIRPGNRLEIHKDGLSWSIEVVALSAQRRPAPEAAQLYVEDETSRLNRQEQVRARRETGAQGERPRGRPTKRDRRMIERLIRGGDPGL